MALPIFRRSGWLSMSFTLALAQSIAIASSASTISTQMPSMSTSFTRSTTSPSPSAAPSATPSNSSSSRPPQTFTIAVGAGGFFYNPDSVDDVRVNDTVEFQFYPKDHSVARAEYMNPCVPYESNGHPGEGFFSGLKIVDDFNNLTSWSIVINSTEPIFYYCTAPDSCIDNQMVGVINPNATQTLAAQKAAAKNAKFMVAPGDQFPSEASTTSSAVSTTPTTATSPPASHHGTHLSAGAIAGIAVGGIAVLAVCAALFFYVGRTKSLKEVLHRRDASVSKLTPMTSPGTDFGGHSPAHPSQAFPAQSPFSPAHSQPDYSGNLPAYGLHHVADGHPVGWSNSPPPHPSAIPAPLQLDGSKAYTRAEMPSPPAHRQEFTAELEAPIKSARG